MLNAFGTFLPLARQQSFCFLWQAQPARATESAHDSGDDYGYHDNTSIAGQQLLLESCNEDGIPDDRLHEQ